MKRIIVCSVILILLQALSGCIEPKIEVPKYVLKAVLKIEPQVAYPNQSIIFDASASQGEIEEYWWNFNLTTIVWQLGDKVMTYSYQQHGIYRVGLKVVDKGGNESATADFVYVNYQATISGSLEKSQKNDTYMPIGTQVKRAVITLNYEPEYALITKKQLENLDLSAKVRWGDNYTYVKSDNATPDNGTAVVELSKWDILFNAYADSWYAEVYYNITVDAPGKRQEVHYTLKIEIYYNS
ncbi:MAG: PKD domain-containing protein [Candidatus Thermoplasmatota archaeon]|nr:PKD domain-containing protein [Candidatus Thermoplasmatota archaeon]